MGLNFIEVYLEFRKLKFTFFKLIFPITITGDHVSNIPTHTLDTLCCKKYVDTFRNGKILENKQSSLFKE